MPHCYEDLHVGQEFTTAGRTVTEADLLQFAGLTGDNSALHTDEEYAQKSMYGRRLVHGMLAASIAHGLMCRTLVFEGTGIGLLGMDALMFQKPVFIGDTLTARFAIESMRETRKSDRGIVVRRVELFNQRSELVLNFMLTGLVQRRVS